MKMRKIMAAGVAATLAVTSLAAVASAESLTFNMATTEGKLNFKSSNGTDFGAAALTTPSVTADDAMFVKATAPTTDATAKMESKPVVTIKGLKKVGTNAVEATASYELKEYYYLGTAAAFATNATAANLADATLWTTNATDNAETKKKEVYYVLSIYKDTAPEGSLVVTQWDRIDTMNVTVNGSYVTTSSDVYGKFGSEWWGVYAVSDIANWDSLTVAAGPADTGDFATKLKAVVDGAKDWNYDSKTMNDKYALLKQTTTNATIMRADVWELSDTDAYNSTTDTGAQDTNQSYDSNGLGTSKNRFAGLASQVADFFNHKTNGTITLKFTAATATDSGWLNGGVPSTQIGIKNLLDANNFALYVNYETSTGSLEATTKVDKNEGTVTFDISEILADLGGQTKGVVTDLYYGLNQGIYYDEYKGTGLLVEEVTLAYEDEAAEDEVIEDEVVEEEEEEVVEEEEEEEVEEEEEEVTIEEEEEVTEEEEEEVDGDMFEEEETEEEDGNPGTGVALAVVPAMIAAAAAVVSKKRK